MRTKLQIIGYKGSMGKRYDAIINYMGWEHSDHVDKDVGRIDEKATHFIVCSPTSTHYEVLCSLPKEAKILCEKPLVANEKELLKLVANHQLVDRIDMVMQYIYMVGTSQHGSNYYNYYRQGSETFLDNMFQVIALARGNITISNTSPVWRCCLNNMRLHQSSIDNSYILMLEHWLGETYRNNVLSTTAMAGYKCTKYVNVLIEMHKIVWSYRNGNENSDPCPSTLNIDEIPEQNS